MRVEHHASGRQDPWLSALPDSDCVVFAPAAATTTCGCDAAEPGYGTSPLGLAALVGLLATHPFLSHHGELPAADRARWQSACDGDAQVRQELVESTLAAMALRLRRFSGHDLDEVRQMIAAALLQAFELGIEPASSLDGFLQWRARGQISRFVRQRARDGRMSGAEALDWACDGESPLRRVTESELWGAVMECIAKVPSKDQRESFAQRVVDGQEPREIAAERGVEARRVRVWIARAAALVRECLSRRFGREEQP